jgi:hypothetical protein
MTCLPKSLDQSKSSMNSACKMGHSFQNTTPPMGNLDLESSEDDSYFYKTYIPLSSLPTPPMSSDSALPMRAPALEAGGDLDPTLLSTNVFATSPALSHSLNWSLTYYFSGPAIHLSNLIPSAASLMDPSVRLVHALLVRAELPLPTIALAAIILDSLNSRFALSWRRSCPLSASSASPELPKSHIDSIRPELVILASLIISVKFLDDQENSTRLYSEDWGSARWTCEQINATEKCIMENLGYRILPLWNEELIGDALYDMERAGESAQGQNFQSNSAFLSKQIQNSRPMGSRKAARADGNQLTPALSPVIESTSQFQGSSPRSDSFESKARTSGHQAPTFDLVPRYNDLALGLTGF